MADIDFDTTELAELFPASASTQTGDDILSALVEPIVTPDSAAEFLSAPLPSVAAASNEYSWESAKHLLPEWAGRLIARYPAIGVSDHPVHGRVLVAAYLEDKGRRVRRNLKIGNDLFFYAEELELIEPDTKHLDCRVVIKTLPYRSGMCVRYWENTASGDAPGRSGTFELVAGGLKRMGLASK